MVTSEINGGLMKGGYIKFTFHAKRKGPCPYCGQTSTNTKKFTKTVHGGEYKILGYGTAEVATQSEDQDKALSELISIAKIWEKTPASHRTCKLKNITEYLIKEGYNFDKGRDTITVFLGTNTFNYFLIDVESMTWSCPGTQSKSGGTLEEFGVWAKNTAEELRHRAFTHVNGGTYDLGRMKKAQLRVWSPPIGKQHIEITAEGLGATDEEAIKEAYAAISNIPALMSSSTLKIQKDMIITKEKG